MCPYPSLNCSGAALKRKRHDDVVKSEKVGNTDMPKPRTADIVHSQNIQVLVIWQKDKLPSVQTTQGLYALKNKKKKKT